MPTIIETSKPEDFSSMKDLLDQLVSVETQIRKLQKRQREIESQIGQGLGLSTRKRKEKRMHLRVPCQLNSNLVFEDKLASGLVKDLSLGGAFIETKMKVFVGEKIQITIRKKKQSLTLNARVMWRKPSNPTGIGVQFDEPEDENMQRLLKIQVSVLQDLMA